MGTSESLYTTSSQFTSTNRVIFCCNNYRTPFRAIKVKLKSSSTFSKSTVKKHIKCSFSDPTLKTSL